MTIRPIVIHGEPVLHQPTTLVEESEISSPEIQQLIADMYETMEVAHGVGLAANQVGIGKRIFVYHCPDTEGPDGTQLPADKAGMRKGCVINPVLETSEIPETMPADDGSDDEGCLSLPVTRAQSARPVGKPSPGKDEHGNDITVEGYGFFARCLQHETGHLDGYVYTDTLIGRYKRQAKKIIKRNGWTEPGYSWMPGEDADPFGHDD